jgi:hypothetical protein
MLFRLLPYCEWCTHAKAMNTFAKRAPEFHGTTGSYRYGSTFDKLQCSLHMPGIHGICAYRSWPGWHKSLF